MPLARYSNPPHRLASKPVKCVCERGTGKERARAGERERERETPASEDARSVLKAGGGASRVRQRRLAGVEKTGRLQVSDRILEDHEESQVAKVPAKQAR